MHDSSDVPVDAQGIDGHFWLLDAQPGASSAMANHRLEQTNVSTSALYTTVISNMADSFLERTVRSRETALPEQRAALRL
jgi:hypothetical protein